MGGGASKQAPACSCSVKAADLPYEIYEAAKAGLPQDILKYLEKKGNVNATYKGETMLHAACANGRENVLTMLLNKRSLCLNVRNNYNETALMQAAGSGYRDCVEIILVHNPRCSLEIYCKNNNGLSALDIAHINNRQDVAFCMMSYLKNRPPPTGGKTGLQPKGGNDTPAPAAAGAEDTTTKPTNTKSTDTTNK